MLRQTLIAAAALSLALPASAETKSYDMDSFNKISASAGVTVIFEAGDTQSIIAENKNGNFDRLILKTSGDTLVIGREKTSWFSRKSKQNYTVRISGPAITAAGASSGSSVSVNGVTGESVKLTVSSGARLDASKIKADSISISASSGSSLSASGACNSAGISVSSGASIDADDMICAEVEVSASSGSNVTAHATASVDGSASSGASVNVVGGATNIEKSRSSGGSVKVS